MFELKVLTILFALKNLFVPSIGEKSLTGFRFHKEGYKIERTGTLPDTVRESSSVEVCRENVSYWTTGDGGTKSQLYEINEQGQVLSVLALSQLVNKDWEEMTRDDKGNIYIGDFGNNTNSRKDLRIYKINVNENNRVDTIAFHYTDQTLFPPAKKEMNFDCEAMFWYQDSLYLFSKNRGKKCMKVYCLTDKAGTYPASIRQKIYIDGQITSAAISPDLSMVTLLSYGKIYFFHTSLSPYFRINPYFKMKFNSGGQSEALVFYNNTDLFVTNEQGQLFRIFKKKK